VFSLLVLILSACLGSVLEQLHTAATGSTMVQRAKTYSDDAKVSRTCIQSQSNQSCTSGKSTTQRIDRWRRNDPRMAPYHILQPLVHPSSSTFAFDFFLRLASPVSIPLRSLVSPFCLSPKTPLLCRRHHLLFAHLHRSQYHAELLPFHASSKPL